MSIFRRRATRSSSFWYHSPDGWRQGSTAPSASETLESGTTRATS